MNRTITLTTVMVASLVAAVGLAIRSGNAAGFVPQEHEKERCSVATLRGSYLVTGRGEAPIGDQNANFPTVTIAVWNFDGRGNMSGFGTASAGGTITRRLPLTATYTLDSDCTGTFQFGSGAGWELFVTSDGSEGETLNLNTGSIGTRSFKRR
jgi:hypothetical protein